MVKIIFLLMLIIHGIIHLMGFLKGYGLVEFNQLPAMSKFMGVFWLLTGILLIMTATFILLEKEWWWIPAIVAVFSSQVLIISVWSNAKYGTIANIIIVIAIILAIATWRWNIQVNNEVNILLAQNTVQENTIITEKMIAGLPSPVQIWLNNSGIVGHDRISTMYLKQSGVMKLKPEQKNWTKSEAEQYMTIDNPGFFWKVNMEIIPFIKVSGRDLFMDGNGKMQIKIASLIPVVDVTGNEKTNQSTLQRYLMELMWYPSAAISEYITWESIDEYTAKATMTYNGTSGVVTFYFNKEGDVIKSSALRYKENVDNSPLVECIGEVKEFKVIDGVKIPTKIDISWMFDEGKFTWYRFEVSDVKFNFKQ